MNPEAFLAETFGRECRLKRNESPRVGFAVEDALRLLADFNPHVGRLVHCQKMHRYASEGASVPTPDWSDSPLKFWSALMCRVHNGAYEDVEDERRIAEFLAERDLTTAEAYCKCCDHWTVVLNQVQGASSCLQGLHNALWCLLGISGGINLYLTPPFAAGKAPHVDEHDVFILQQAGAKKWFLLADDLRGCLRDATLTPGDVLYLPQGVPHRACCAGAEPSLHLAVSVSRAPLTGAGLLAACAELRGRRPVPREAARRAEELRRRLAAGAAPLAALRQLPAALRGPRGGALRALDAADLPEHPAPAAAWPAALAAELRALAAEALPGLRGPGGGGGAGGGPGCGGRGGGGGAGAGASGAATGAAPGAPEAPGAAGVLEALLALAPRELAAEVGAGFWAWREHLFLEHYMVHSPPALPRAAARAEEEDEHVWWRRRPDAAALLAGDGALLLNGYRIADLDPAMRPAIRFCLGVHTGSAGRPFQVRDLPGPRSKGIDALQLLARYRGVQAASCPGKGA